MTLSIIIPVYNEEKTVRDLISRVKKAALPKGIAKSILVIDDGSSDKTPQILKKTRGITVYTHTHNKGKGAAVRTGLTKAKGDIILIQDADLEYNPKDYKKLLKPLLSGDAVVVYGSRLKNYPLRIAGARRTPLITHYIGNRFLSEVTNMLYGSSLSDMETCYKVFKKEVIKGLKLYANKFDIEPEITVKILKRGYDIYEVPITVKPRGYEEGKKISWKDGFAALWTLAKYRFTD